MISQVRNIFLYITTISLLLLGYIYYNNKQFNDNPLSQEIVNRINQKNHHLKKLIYQKYGLSVNIPIKISSKIKDNLFGLAVYDNGNIKIILNKNRFQESEEYMIDYM